jgi:hypothetical protein
MAAATHAGVTVAVTVASREASAAVVVVVVVVLEFPMEHCDSVRVST